MKEIITRKEFNEMYEADGHTGLPKCRCCGRIDTDTADYYEVIGQMGCLDCNCDACQKERQEELDRVADIIEAHKKDKSCEIVPCFYCRYQHRR